MSKLDQLRALREAATKPPPKVVPVRAAEAVVIPATVQAERTARTGGATPPTGAKRGRPLDSEKHKTLAALQPWKAQGMSRRTWFRRRASTKA